MQLQIQVTNTNAQIQYKYTNTIQIHKYNTNISIQIYLKADTEYTSLLSTTMQTTKEEVHGGDRLPESARAFSGGGCKASACKVSHKYPALNISFVCSDQIF